MGKTKIKYFRNDCSNNSEQLEITLSITDLNDSSICCFNSNELFYRAEGNANLILALGNSKQILRVRKSDLSEENPSFIFEDFVQNIEYTKYISRLLGESFTSVPKAVKLNFTNLKKFNIWLQQFRPDDRLHKDIQTEYGLVCRDVTFLPNSLSYYRPVKENTHPTYCIEIKPKQGWTFYDFRNDFAMNDLFHNPVRKCRFCCMQYLKFKNRNINKISKYCPIDLFSGVDCRMTRSVNGLLDTPQNNLRIFRNGILVYGDKVNNSLNNIIKDLFGSSEDGRKILTSLIQKILLKDWITASSKNILANEEIVSKKNQNIQYNCLPEHCILRKVLRLQLLAKDGLMELKNFDAVIHTFDFIKSLEGKGLFDIETHNIDISELNKYEKYFIGATVLDCSMMLTFKACDTRLVDSTAFSNLVSTNGFTYVANVVVTDLDAKRNDHFNKYIRQSNASHKAYLENLEKSNCM